jgi:hypothetical protein
LLRHAEQTRRGGAAPRAARTGRSSRRPRPARPSCGGADRTPSAPRRTAAPFGRLLRTAPPRQQIAGAECRVQQHVGARLVVRAVRAHKTAARATAARRPAAIHEARRANSEAT